MSIVLVLPFLLLQELRADRPYGQPPLFVIIQFIKNSHQLISPAIFLKSSFCRIGFLPSIFEYDEIFDFVCSCYLLLKV